MVRFKTRPLYPWYPLGSRAGPDTLERRFLTPADKWENASWTSSVHSNHLCQISCLGSGSLKRWTFTSLLASGCQLVTGSPVLVACGPFRNRVRITLLSCDSVFIVSTRALSFKGTGKAQFRRIGLDSFKGGVKLLFHASVDEQHNVASCSLNLSVAENHAS